MKSVMLRSIIESAEQSFDMFSRLDGRGRTGGFLAIGDFETGLVSVVEIGEIGDPDKRATYRRNAEEKVRRLLERRSDISSWQSRDLSQSQYGGGVVVEGGIVLAFSGFSELVDEAYSVYIAHWAAPCLTTPAIWREISDLSQNPYMREYGVVDHPRPPDND